MNDFERKLVDFKEIVFGLQDILDAENDALETFNVQQALGMYEDKAKAVGVYRDYVAFFIKHNQLIAELEVEDRELLRNMILDLNESLARNEVLLKTRIEVSKNVMSSIVSIAKNRNKNNATSYGKMGDYTQRDVRYNSLAINQTL